MMLDKMIDQDEQVLWSGRPQAVLYILGSPLLIVFALVWLFFDLGLFNAVGSMGFATSGRLERVEILFMLVHLAPVWYTFGTMIYRALLWHKIEYALTTRRVYRSSGIFGTDISSLELREINNLSVDVNPLEHLLGVGTIRLTPDVTTGSGEHKRTIAGYRFKHIRDPYELYNRIKKISLDVSTDQQYPNAYRPDENPGYRTEYTEK